MVGVGDEPLAEPDVPQRVIVPGRSRALVVEGRVDVADVRQRAVFTGRDERGASRQRGGGGVGIGERSVR
jgi:hypothetical protein